MTSVTASRIRGIANAIAGLSGLLVVALHLLAGADSSTRPIWRPAGEPTMAVFVGWMICVVLCIPALILTRGRSRAALGALAAVVISAALVFV
jgi:O-antigen ligase